MLLGFGTQGAGVGVSILGLRIQRVLWVWGMWVNFECFGGWVSCHLEVVLSHCVLHGVQDVRDLCVDPIQLGFNSDPTGIVLI